jgi:hypothetical protein
MLRTRIPGYHRLHRAYLLATALGVVIHETAHAEMVEDCGFTVHEICRFQLDNPAGYVRHDEPADYWPAFAISTAPFLLNSGFAFTAFALARFYIGPTPIGSLSVTQLGIVGILCWIGVSAGVHAFPSMADALNIWAATKRNWLNPLAILGLPVLALLIVLTKLERYGAGLLYTAGVGLTGVVVMETILAA